MLHRSVARGECPLIARKTASDNNPWISDISVMNGYRRARGAKLQLIVFPFWDRLGVLLPLGQWKNIQMPHTGDILRWFPRPLPRQAVASQPSGVMFVVTWFKMCDAVIVCNLAAQGVCKVTLAHRHGSFQSPYPTDLAYMAVLAKLISTYLEELFNTHVDLTTYKESDSGVSSWAWYRQVVIPGSQGFNQLSPLISLGQVEPSNNKKGPLADAAATGPRPGEVS